MRKLRCVLGIHGPRDQHQGQVGYCQQPGCNHFLGAITNGRGGWARYVHPRPEGERPPGPPEPPRPPLDRPVS